MPPGVGGVYVQIREAHTRDGWDIGGPWVAERQHQNEEERTEKCERRPDGVKWMRGVCDAMTNDFSDAYGSWPTAFFVFECHSKPASGQSAVTLVHRSRPSADAHIDVMHTLAALWDLTTRGEEATSV